jgi:membrane-bound lytic murein transglycosylase D
MKKQFFFFAAILLISIADLKAQSTTGEEIVLPVLDSSEIKLPELCLKDLKALQNCIEFPDLLKGHEEEALPYIEGFAKRRKDYLVRTYHRDQQYSRQIISIFNKYDVPAELRVLIALESAYNPNARSRAGAVGYWQFMDAVAKEYNLKIPQVKVYTHRTKKGKLSVKRKITGTKDERKDFVKSTEAAARYLNDRKRNFDNDWLLIVASYNYGTGNVWNAMAKSKKENPSFWDIKNFLPAETRTYVMNFIALNVIFHNYEKFVKDELVYEVAPADYRLTSMLQ